MYELKSCGLRPTHRLSDSSDQTLPPVLDNHCRKDALRFDPNSLRTDEEGPDSQDKQDQTQADKIQATGKIVVRPPYKKG